MAKKVARPNKKPPEAESRPPTPAEIAALATCERYGNKADELLEILHDLQHQLGYIPEETLPVIGRALNRSRAEVHGVVTFYHDFKRHPIGKHVVKICRAESCQAVLRYRPTRRARRLLIRRPVEAQGIKTPPGGGPGFSSARPMTAPPRRGRTGPDARGRRRPSTDPWRSPPTAPAGR